jgi:DNA invertase Pin-like site-specific DNA recombinase
MTFAEIESQKASMVMTNRRTAAYARYSSELQNERSIEDQHALARAYAEKEGLEIVAQYADRAKTGATLFDRDGLMSLMLDAKAGEFSAVIVESLDRISRDQEDLAAVFKRLAFVGVEIRTLNEGVATDVHVGLRGLVGSLFLKDLGQKVRRGYIGRVKEGKVPGYISYGYRSVPGGQKGEREIDPKQAIIVRRIFQEYAAGRSPRRIVLDLNAEGVPGPRGGRWQPQILVGGDNQKRLLNNTLYLGELRWGTRKTIRNPDTGRPLKRNLPISEHVVVAVPHLAIVDRPLWDAAHGVRKQRAFSMFGEKGRTRVTVVPRNDNLLAGKVLCECGSPMILGSKPARDQSSRFVCAIARKGTGDCHRRQTYSAARIEAAVLDGLKARLSHPELVEVFVKEYRDTMREEQRLAHLERESTRKRLADIEASVMRLVTALEKGTMPEAAIHSRLEALESERVALAERQKISGLNVNVIELHPEAVRRNQEAIGSMHGYLSGKTASVGVRETFRTLIECVVVRSTPPRMPYELEIKGRLAAMLGLDLNPPVRSVPQVLADSGLISSRIDKTTSEKAGV